MDANKNAIEAIVHPLVASERRKNTLRRELWAHFCALVEDELRNDSDRVKAADAALRRLGEPEEIRTAFLAILSKGERWLARWDRQPDEATARYVRRVFWLAAPFLAVVPMCFGLQCALVAPDHAVVPWAIMLTLSLWLPSYLFLALREVVRWQSQLRRHHSVAPFFRMYVLHALSTAALTAACVFAGYGCMTAWKGIDDADALAYLYMGSLLMAFQWLALTAVGCYALVREAHHAQIIPDWPYETH